MADDSVKTSIVLPSELHWQMKQAAAKRRVSDTAAVREAIQLWIARPESGQGAAGGDAPRIVSSSWDDDHRTLADIKQFGDVDAIEMVRAAMSQARRLAGLLGERNMAPDERRLLDEYRSASLEKRQRILGAAGKAEDRRPEEMPKPLPEFQVGAQVAPEVKKKKA
jgi:hypothetical protein